METINDRLARLVNNVPEGAEWPPVRRLPVVLLPDAPVPFDRADHCRRIASSGGMTTADRYGSAHMRRIGKIGYQVTKQKKGEAWITAHLRGRGWTRPQVPDFAADMAAARKEA